MATLRLCSFPRGFLEIDTDASNRITAFRGQNVTVVGGRTGGEGPRYSATFGAIVGGIAVPTSPAGRIQLTAFRNGWDGLDGMIGYVGG